MTTIRPTGDDKRPAPAITIEIHIKPEQEDADEAARRIIRLIREYRRQHGGQDPLG